MPIDGFILGDSHVICLIKAAQGLGLSVVGGPIMWGPVWESAPFVIDPKLGLRFMDDQTNARLATLLKKAGVRHLTELKCPVLTTVGFHTDAFIKRLRENGFVTGNRAVHLHTSLSAQALHRSLIDARRKHWEFLEWLSAFVPIIAVTSPPSAKPPALASALEEMVAKELRSLPVRTLLTRGLAADDEGLLQARFREKDGFHANLEYGAMVLSHVPEISARVG